MLPHGPRPTTIAAQQQRRAEGDDRGPGQPRRGPRQRARRGRRGSGRRRRHGSARSRTSRSRRRRRPAGGRGAKAGSARRPFASITACPTCAANAERDEDRRRRRRGSDESSAMVIASGTLGWARRAAAARQATAAPPGLGPAVATTTARGLTLRTRPQLAQVSMSGRPAEAAHRADDRELVVAALAAVVPDAIDQRVAPAVRAGPAGRSAGRPRRSARPAGPPRSATFARGLRTW